MSQCQTGYRLAWTVWNSVFISCQAGLDLNRLGLAGLSSAIQIRARRDGTALLGGLVSVLRWLSLNRIFCKKDYLLPLLRKSPMYETYTISNTINLHSPPIAKFYPSTRPRLIEVDPGISNHMQKELMAMPLRNTDHITKLPRYSRLSYCKY